MTITRLSASAYTIPTDRPEADGTLAWDKTTMVVAEVGNGDHEGIGWTYAGASAVGIIDGLLAPEVIGTDEFDIPQTAEGMARAVRNLGRPGLAACAISAVDIALWDLKARTLGVALSDLFGRARQSVPIYGSGGFTTYDDDITESQLRGWVEEEGIPRVKVKIGESWGTNPDRDLHRMALARRVIGDHVELYVDANGGYTAKQAIRLGRNMSENYGVTWFEEPVSSDNLAGLHQVRQSFAGDVAAGEYGYTLGYFARMLEAGGVDCLQADVTRCGGYTVWLRTAALAEAHHVEISGHCAPNLHSPVAAAVPNLRHVEYFYDHHRIETMLFEGALPPIGGCMTPDSSRTGHGLSLRSAEAARYRAA
jgi:L-alanine-DL-glutamate epimerase-like enolase superfamily enzyme